MKKTIIFDLDGTLLDSMHVWDHVGEQYLQSIHKTPNKDLQEVIESMSLSQSAHYMKQHYNLTQSIEEIQQGIEDCVFHHYAHDLELKEGAKECLQKCHEQGIQLILLSASSQAMVNVACKRCGILSYFDTILTCESMGYSKDNPKIYEELIKQLNLKKEDCLFVEDAYYAIQAMKKIQVKVYAVYEETNKKDWKAICELSDAQYDSLSQMEV